MNANEAAVDKIMILHEIFMIFFLLFEIKPFIIKTGSFLMFLWFFFK